MSYLLGIDLGTTYTAAAVLRLRAGEPVGDPEVVALGSNGSEMPSVVLSGEDGSLLVGDAAERRAQLEPDRVAREFKRRIGDPTPVSLGDGALPAEELSALLVRHVVDVAVAREGGVPEKITVTHPASWGSHKLDLLRSAVDTTLAGRGIPAVTLLAEPQAAAVCYAAGERVEPGSTIAVYDLGGGTFDAAVVRKDTDGFALLGRPEGVEYLGGVDFDEVVFEHVRAAAPEAFDGLDESDSAVWASVARLRRECREAKEALSADTEVTVPVWLPGGSGQSVVRLHRGEFEELIGPKIEDTVDALRRAVSSADLEPSSVTAVLLVGGSSRIPLVAQTVSEQLGRPVAVDEDPKNAIARGAALASFGRNLSWPAVQIPVQVPAQRAAEPDRGSDAERTGPIATVALSPRHVDPPTERFAAVGLLEHSTRYAPVADSWVTHDVGPSRGQDNRARWLIGAGGFAGALALLAVVLFWPASSVTLDGASARSIVPDTVAPTTAPPAPAAAPPVTQAPAAAGGNATTDPTKARTAASPVAPAPAPARGAAPIVPAPGVVAPAPVPAPAPGPVVSNPNPNPTKPIEGSPEPEPEPDGGSNGGGTTTPPVCPADGSIVPPACTVPTTPTTP